MTTKKVLVALGALGPAAVFAEGTSPIDSAVTQLQTAATGAISSVLPAVIAVLVALFGIVGVIFAYKKIAARFGR